VAANVAWSYQPRPSAWVLGSHAIFTGLQAGLSSSAGRNRCPMSSFMSFSAPRTVRPSLILRYGLRSTATRYRSPQFGLRMLSRGRRCRSRSSGHPHLSHHHHRAVCRGAQDIFFEMAYDVVNRVSGFRVARGIWSLLHRAGKPRSIEAIHRHTRGASPNAHISAGVSKVS
jgi:hypothetical protein